MKTVDYSVNTVVQEPQGQKSLEAVVFKLKLQWMMAKDENEKRRISEEIRQQMSSVRNK